MHIKYFSNLYKIFFIKNNKFNFKKFKYRIDEKILKCYYNEISSWDIIYKTYMSLWFSFLHESKQNDYRIAIKTLLFMTIFFHFQKTGFLSDNMTILQIEPFIHVTYSLTIYTNYEIIFTIQILDGFFNFITLCNTTGFNGMLCSIVCWRFYINRMNESYQWKR